MPRPKKRNYEKSWLRILKEVLKKRGNEAAWFYVTALRGPDGDDVPWVVKAVFTAPLRGQSNLAVADIASYNTFAKRPGLMSRAFRDVIEDKSVPYHYLNHLINAWGVLEPKIADILTKLKDMKANGQVDGLSDLCYEYQQAINEWFAKTEAVEEEEDG